MNSLLRITLATILALSLSVFIGCSSDDDDPPTSPPEETLFELTAQNGDDYLTAGTKNITGDALWADMQGAADEDLFMIDFRSADHYANLGHIEGSINWTIGNLPDNIAEITSGAKVICICYTGQTASHAAAYLNMMGVNAYNLKWGMCGWTSDVAVNLGKWTFEPTGHETETDAHALATEYEFPTLSGTDVANATHDHCNTFFDGGLHYITATNLYANLNDGDTSNDPFLLNYWSETDYNAGHIPGSYQFNPTELGPEEMLKYVPTDKQVVVWCYTGQTSAQVSTYLNMLGYDAYSLKFGMNAIDPSLCGTKVYHEPTTDYPVVTGTAD